MEHAIRTFFITGIITVTAAVAGCTAMTGDGGTSSSSAMPASSAASSAQDSNVVVSIDDTNFNLDSVRISKGSTVTWINDGSNPHSVTGDDGGPDSGTIVQGGTYSYTFNSAGTYTYHCDLHRSMVGVVVVTE